MMPRLDTRFGARLLLAAALLALGACANTDMAARGPALAPPSMDTAAIEPTPADEVFASDDAAFSFLGLRGVEAPAADAFASEIPDDSLIYAPEYAKLNALLMGLESRPQESSEPETSAPGAQEPAIELAEADMTDVAPAAPAGGESDALAARAPLEITLDGAFTPETAAMEPTAEVAAKVANDDEEAAPRFAALEPADIPAYWLVTDDASEAAVPDSGDAETAADAAFMMSDEAQDNETTTELAALDDSAMRAPEPALKPEPKPALSTPMTAEADAGVLTPPTVDAATLPEADAAAPAPAVPEPAAEEAAAEASMMASVEEPGVPAMFPSGKPNWYGRAAEPVVVDAATAPVLGSGPGSQPAVATLEKVRPNLGLPTLDELLANGPTEEETRRGVRIIRRAQ
jgi:hypothetical protein